MTLFAGLLETALAPLLNRLRSIFPPEISGQVILMIGLSAGIAGLRSLLGATASPVGTEEWAVGAVTLATMYQGEALEFPDRRPSNEQIRDSDNTLLATVHTVARDWALGSDTVVYTLSPLSHNLGIGAMILAIAIGGELVVHDLPRGKSLLDRRVDTGTSYLIGVPTHERARSAAIAIWGVTRVAQLGQ